MAAILAVAEQGSATKTCVRSTTDCIPRLDFSLDSWVSPRSLPAERFAPVGIGIVGRVSRGGAHPDALREMVLEVDKDVEFDVRGLPICEGGLRPPIRRPPEYLRRICRKAIVGTGKATMEIAFAGQPPIRVKSPVTIFNGGMRDRLDQLLIHLHTSIPAPADIVATVRLRREGPGWRATVKIPKIAGGAGSLTSFRLNLKRFFFYRGERKSFLSARCPDGRFKISAPKIVFKNEARTPGVPAQTVLKGTVISPCTPIA